ncbi:SAV_2336 N-terminal domain-related protein [Streptomyces pseudovenezuelae]|uniref:DNA-binding SARP family transcriptional activator/beta-phosphoglucomutase-like phosphatase (HAD superfamily)/tRNA A-37 threonylcarbamoyl transferase component Bud32 n=1 Tax=Streptomyces pseudovenezuelae TaxID=67350 RepID=A0ABT6LGQ5_9ACTN|nr:SAV_2336 N-terminal domain-related protein [Streptomyces pseudovenezuelae]MDH6215491.1 DNA-binding SARP family transcriptional activator/beta-phosphoglucomutase-like phosphatase (HAD superfamily)/tRNA A-37 threonylcarbamoyl transferase component Bud32 [Streptomyces pseudovenezuelae]
MASDPTPDDGTSSAAADRLTALLATAAGPEGSTPTPRELAELLWLARQLAPEQADEGAAGTEREGPVPAAPSFPQPTSTATPTATPTVVPPDSPKPSPPAPTPDGRVPLHLPKPSPAPDPAPTANGLFLAPAPPMLHHPLALQRALRPLKRKVPAPRARVLDEYATADRIARLGARPEAWLPVLRPDLDRWLRLNLVYDTGPTMPVWRPLVRELHTALAQSGIFRSVALHPAGPDGHARHVPDPGDGRTVTLVVSDCMGPQWRPGPAGDRWYRTLHHWAGRMPVSVLQPLPEHLWLTTALPAEPGLLAAATAVAPTARLAFTPFDPDSALGTRPGAVLPVLEAGPSWLANWSTLIASPGGAHTPGAAAQLPARPAPQAEPSAPDIAALPPRDLVLRFRSTASPAAFRLAGHLALADPSLPVMRLVQRALESSPRPQHLAEIILSGMLTTIPGPPGSYDFRPGVRDLLLRSLPRTARGRTREFLARVGGLIDERAGLAAGDFRARAGGREGEAFATVREETVRRLGGGAGERDRLPDGGGRLERLLDGRYRLIWPRGRARWAWQAEDVRGGGSVTVHLYAEQTAPQERFLREARALAGLRHPNVMPVLDYGVSGESPYLVTEFVEGVTLAELEQGSGPGVNFRVFAQLVVQGVAGLEALHAAGLVRGQRGPSGLLLRPDGTLLIGRFALGEESVGKDPAADFLEFDALVRKLASGVAAPTQSERLLTDIGRGELSAREAAPHLATAPDPEPWTFRMLGPLRISLPEEPEITVRLADAQALLCMLLLKQGRPITHAELAQGIWDEPPDAREAARRIDLFCSEILRRLGPGILAAVPDGYALHAPAAHIDVLHCERLLGRRSPEQDPRAERALIQEALDLWYGEPLDGIPGPAAKATRAHLHTLRLTLCATRAQLDLDLGDFEQAAIDLTALLQEHPDREDFRWLHILALQGMGRIAEAIESYESYAEVRARQHGDPIDPALHELYQELRASPERGRPTIVFDAPGLSEHPQARDALGRAVISLLSSPDLTPHQYDMTARSDGYVVLAEPEADVLPLLDAVLRELPEALADLDDPPPFRVIFWHGPLFTDTHRSGMPRQVATAIERNEADILVVLSPVLHEEFAQASAVTLFEPFRMGSPNSQPLSWYRPLHLPSPEPEPEPEPESRDLVSGPFTTPDIARLEPPDPGRSAIVHTLPDGPLTLLNPNQPWGTRPPRLTTYYEIDLTTQQAEYEVSLPSSGGGTFTTTVELSWHVDDPVAFFLGETASVSALLLDHFLKEASRVTRRHPLRRAGAAQQAVRAGLRRWPVPGLSVSVAATLSPEGEQQPPGSGPVAVADRSPADLLRDAQTVLIGFDGVLTRLFSPNSARKAVNSMLADIAEHRGRPVTESFRHPLDVLRAFAFTDVAEILYHRLNQLELHAAHSSLQTDYATALLVALRTSGRRVHVVADVYEEAVHRHLTLHSLTSSVDTVTGRAQDPRLLMPDPDCLRRSLRTSPGRDPASRAVLISSSVTERDAALELGLPFIGYAETRAGQDELRAAGCRVLAQSLMELADAAYTQHPERS